MNIKKKKKKIQDRRNIIVTFVCEICNLLGTVISRGTSPNYARLMITFAKTKKPNKLQLKDKMLRVPNLWERERKMEKKEEAES